MTASNSFLMDIEGEYPVNPELRIRPTTQRTSFHAALGWTRRRRYLLTNTSSVAMEGHPYAIDFGATNTLVSAAEMQSSGNDIRVLINGLEVARTLNTMNSATSLYIWFIIPYLNPSASMTVEVIYGNSAAGSPPTLTSGVDLPAFDITTTGTRSTNTSWLYIVQQTAGNAGVGGWWLSSGTVKPEVRQHVPGSWQTDSVWANGADASWQLPYSVYVATGTKYNARLDARIARPGALVQNEGTGGNGVSIEVPVGIVSMTADFRYTNQYSGDTNLTPIGMFAIVSRNADTEDWQIVYSNVTLAATETTIASATYTPTTPAKQLACCILPYNRIAVDPTTRADRYANVSWYTTLTLTLSSAITQALVTTTSDWTPANLSSTELALWLDASVLTGSDGSAISQWSDLSGNARHAVQATGANQPILKLAVQNGLNAVRFDGTNDSLTIASALGVTQPYAVFFVVKITAGAAETDVVFSAAGMITGYMAGGAPFDWYMYGGNLVLYNTANAVDTVPHVHGFVFNGASSVGRYDAVPATVNAGALNPSGGCTIGSYGGTNWTPMDLMELIVVDTTVDAALAERIEGYLAKKWGTTATLPSYNRYALSTDTVYDFGLELRYLGGAETIPVPPYTSLLLGNERLATGVGTPHLMTKLDQQVVLFTEDRRVEVWNTGLTAKVETPPVGVVTAVEGIETTDGSTVEIPAIDWLLMTPIVNPIVNPSADTDVSSWTVEARTGVTLSALTRATALGPLPDGTTTYFTSGITANASADFYPMFYKSEPGGDGVFPLGGRKNVTVGFWQNTSLATAFMVPYIWTYDADLTPLYYYNGSVNTPLAAVDTWYRRVWSFDMPETAAYYYVGVLGYSTIGGTSGTYRWSVLTINDTELGLVETNPGIVTMSARWKTRYAYNG